jgi:hypothetical protein
LTGDPLAQGQLPRERKRLDDLKRWRHRVWHVRSKVGQAKVSGADLEHRVGRQTGRGFQLLFRIDYRFGRREPLVPLSGQHDHGVERQLFFDACVTLTVRAARRKRHHEQQRDRKTSTVMSVH